MSSNRTESSSGTRVYNFVEHGTRMANIVEAISRTRKIMVICGSSTSSTHGMMSESVAVSVPSGRTSAQMTLTALVKQCSTTNVKSNELREDMLAAFNVSMANRRVQARVAAIGPFQAYLHRLFREGRLIQCLTHSYDGLETRDLPEMGRKVVMMRGDNRVLRCCTPNCPNMAAEAVDLEPQLLSGKTVLCPPCTRQANSIPNTRRKGLPAVRFLRPAVQDRIDKDLLPGGSLRQAMLEEADKSELCIIAGVSLQCESVFDLVCDLASRVREHSGAVVFIDQQKIKGRNMENLIDIHLKEDIEVCAERVMQSMDEIRAHPENEVGEVGDNDLSDLWYDIVHNDLQGTAVSEDPEWTFNQCCICNSALSEWLTQCEGCLDWFCSQDMCPNPSELCVKRDMFSSEPTTGPFKCPWCWKHSDHGIYPHFVRPNPRRLVDARGARAPRMVMIVYYLDQFWPITKHLCAVVAGRWKAKGWPCFIEPVKLDELADRSSVLEKCPWEQNSFQAFVVWITHALSETKGYQIKHSESSQPVEFFSQTLLPANKLLQRALVTRAFVLCCGHTFLSPQHTQQIRTWIDGNTVVDSLVGCLNPRLAPAFMVNLMARLTTALSFTVDRAETETFNCWLSDGVACNHSDLVVLQKGQDPVMWLFSPFDSRPLGKVLPNLLNTCNCPPVDPLLADPEAGQKRKIWVVKHDGKDKMRLADISVKALCNVCKQTWLLPTEHLVGILRKSNGLFAAVVPYFAK